jgi:hypothetical protein
VRRTAKTFTTDRAATSNEDLTVTQTRLTIRVFSIAQDRQLNGCLHTNSFAGRKEMEHEVLNVCVKNRAGVNLLDWSRRG